jgi:hypothetical protein
LTGIHWLGAAAGQAPLVGIFAGFAFHGQILRAGNGDKNRDPKIQIAISFDGKTTTETTPDIFRKGIPRPAAWGRHTRRAPSLSTEIYAQEIN